MRATILRILKNGIPTAIALALLGYMMGGLAGVGQGGTTTEPSATCVAANNITVGSSQACSVMVQSSGTCTPVIYTIPGYNFRATGCP